MVVIDNLHTVLLYLNQSFKEVVNFYTAYLCFSCELKSLIASYPFEVWLDFEDSYFQMI